MKQLMPCLRMRSTFSFIFSFSAISISATLAVESTRTLEPKICGTHTHTHVTGVNGTALVLALSAWARPYLDLVCVHAGVGDEDVGVLDPFGLVHSDPLVQQEACEEQEEQSHDHYYSCAAFWLAEPHTVNQSHNFHRSIWTPVVTDTLQTHYYYLRWDNEYI